MKANCIFSGLPRSGAQKSKVEWWNNWFRRKGGISLSKTTTRKCSCLCPKVLAIFTQICKSDASHPLPMTPRDIKKNLVGEPDWEVLKGGVCVCGEGGGGGLAKKNGEGEWRQALPCSNKWRGGNLLSVWPIHRFPKRGRGDVLFFLIYKGGGEGVGLLCSTKGNPEKISTFTSFKQQRRRLEK